MPAERESVACGILSLVKRENHVDRLEDLAAFVAIVEQGGLTAAARHVRRSLQSVSRSLGTLERSVGVELVRRTTRRSNATEAGLGFYQRIKPALAQIQEARLEVSNRRAEPAGLLRIGASVSFAPLYLVPAVAAFMKRHPQIDVELKLSDRFVDLVDEDLDLAIRIADMSDSTLQARRLGQLRRVMFGAPAYFAKYGRPAHPDQLAKHQCMIRTTDPDAQGWPFRINGKQKIVRVSGRFRADSTAATNAAVAAGLGLGYAPMWQIRDLLASKAVEIVLERFEMPAVSIHAIWPATRLLSAKTRLCIDFLAERFKREL
jgi:DNA-binding transcriptional LysR family regulator